MDPFTAPPAALAAHPHTTMSASMSTASSHPLAHTLSALRAQLAQVQRAAHGQGMQLQGRMLEATIAREGRERAEQAMRQMEREIEVLRCGRCDARESLRS